MLVKNELTKNDILNNDLKESIQVLPLAKQGLFAKARDKSNKFNKEDLSIFELAVLGEADLLYLVKKNKYDEALNLARRIKEGNPNGYFTNLYLTHYYENKMNWIGANDCNLHCLEINPNNVNLILESAKIKWHLDKKDKAFESLAQINNKTTQFLAKLVLITGDGWGRVLYIFGVGLNLFLSRFSLYFFCFINNSFNRTCSKHC